MRIAVFLVALALLQGCASRTLFDDMGGRQGMERVSARFIAGIGDDPLIRPYFENTNLERFHEMFSLHLCSVAGGPCVYTGDPMVPTHTGMGITERDFNRTVDLLIAAMDAEGIPHRVQNRLLQRLAPMRAEIIYR